MSSKNEISISVEAIEEILKEIKEINALCSSSSLKLKVERLQRFVYSFIEMKDKVPVQDIIYDKMVQVKHLNPELHLKLYMLYRNLTSGRISEADARTSYESCLSMYPSDMMVF